MGITEGSWSTLKSLEIARSHPAVVNFDGKLYVFGGGGSNFESMSSSIFYTPETNEWQKISDMPTKRSGTAGFVINDKIYIVGGGYKKPDGNFQFLKTVEIYDPRTDTWQPGPDMLQPHDYPAATLIDDQIYILGGHHPDACLGGPKTDPGFDFCERWRPGDDSWQSIAELPTPRFAASALTINGKILTAGGVAFTPEGFNNYDFFENYTPEDNQWIKDSELTLPWTAAGQGMCNINNNIFFVGGYSTDNIHPRASIYLTSDLQWHQVADMPSPRAAMGISAVDNVIYLVGGWADDGRTPLNSVVSYRW